MSGTTRETRIQRIEEDTGLPQESVYIKADRTGNSPVVYHDDPQCSGLATIENLTTESRRTSQDILRAPCKRCVLGIQNEDTGRTRAVCSNCGEEIVDIPGHLPCTANNSNSSEVESE